MTDNFDCDLAIVGAGPVGLALAGWLTRRSATRALTIALIDAGSAGAAASASSARKASDARALALSYGSRLLLEALAWPAASAPIKCVHVSQRGHFGRTLIDCREQGLPALGYVVRYGALVRALARALPAGALHHFTDTTANALAQDANGVTLSLKSAARVGVRQLRCRLLINAQGSQWTALSLPPAARDYHQLALLSAVRVEAPQPDFAWERFTRDGPLALLPLNGVEKGVEDGVDGAGDGGIDGAGSADYALVWCGRPDDTQRRLHSSEPVFLAELGNMFGARLGRFTAVGARCAFPLALKVAAAPVIGRIAAVGNAAQSLHPVAAQGLNLGLRDAYALADALSRAGAAPAALAGFAEQRQLDRRLTIEMTDKLARIFSADFAAPLTPWRSLALAMLECLPPLKAAFTQRMIFGWRR